MSYETLEPKHEGPVAWLTLNRPELLNAMNRQPVTEPRDFFGGHSGRPEIRVVVLHTAFVQKRPPVYNHI